MKLAVFFILLSVVLTLLSVAVVIEADFSERQNQAWEDFKIKYNKHYSSKCEEKKRKRIFLQNKCKVDKTNRDYAKGLISYMAEVYSWADLTDAEFLKQKTGLNPPRKPGIVIPPKNPGAIVPVIGAGSLSIESPPSLTPTTGFVPPPDKGLDEGVEYEIGLAGPSEGDF